jgi:2-dehydro-3-deoxyphosphogluconate aldolase/(4S)-4-hydroxy-2-oxoglutarate aldolase
MKLFPAEISGGTRALKLYASAFDGVRFLPTGGITGENLSEYLACPNVIGCGGSFMAPKDLLARGDSEGINQLIKSLCR